MMALPVSRASPELSGDVGPDVLTPPPTRHKHSSSQSASEGGSTSQLATDSESCDTSPSTLQSFESSLGINDDAIEDISD